jgi:outer membrane protein TolC
MATLALAASALFSPLASQTAPPADTLALTLGEAVSRATTRSEEVRLAQSQVALARAQVSNARSAALPQVNANFGFTKTLESAFNTGGGFTLPDSLRFNPDPDAPLADRVRYLEQHTQNAAFGALGSLFGNLPFGQENAYTWGLSGSQLLYSGGKVGAAMKIARSFRSASELQLTEQTAEVELQVRSAYYQALLAQELEGISEAALAQAEAFLAQEQLRLRAGRASELEVLRAEVSRDNLRPQLVQARNAAELATLNLKRLTDLPLTQPVRLTTPLTAPSPAQIAADTVSRELQVAQRAALKAAEEQVAIREQQVRIARGSFLPSLSLQSAYGRQLFPSDPLSLTGQWRTDWTVTLGASIPVFQGFRRTAELEQAKVERNQAQIQLAQLRDVLQLQYEQARGEKERAGAQIEAAQRTVDVAQRVYELTVLRYDQGLATQLEVSDARLALLQARTNLAQAIASFYLAEAGVSRATGTTVPATPAVVPEPAQPTPQPTTPPTGEPNPATRTQDGR